jgi:hypothetical protein
MGTPHFTDKTESALISADGINSTSTVLANGATFTGQSEDVSEYASISIFLYTDQDSSADGFRMELSTDGTNWDRAKTATVVGGVSHAHNLAMVSRYFRVVYTNGSVTQTEMRLQVIYHRHRTRDITSGTKQVLSDSDDVTLVRGVNDPYLDISRGLSSDKFSVHIFGEHATVPNGSFEDIWNYGGTDGTYNWPATDETLRVAAGGNINDTSAGTGARTIQIQYLDANGDEQQDQLTLDGVNASTATSSTARRFLKAWVDTAGAIKSNNTGEIVIENSSTGQVVGSISAGVGESELSMYTVPLGYTAYLTRIEVSVSVGTNKDADVRMWQRTNAYTTSAPFGVKRLVRQWVAVQGADNIIEYKSLPQFPEKTDLWFEAQGNGAETAVDIDYDLILIKE